MKAGAFLPSIVAAHDREKPWADWVTGTVLFADVSGFTPMSEALSVLGAEGAEILTDILNRYFARMITIIHSHGGQVMKFGGDALLCFFPEEGFTAETQRTRRNNIQARKHGTHGKEDSERTFNSPFREFRASVLSENSARPDSASSASSAVNSLFAAQQMQQAMSRFQRIKTPVKKFALKMKIGIASGQALLAGVGDPSVRCDYVFAGHTVDLVSEAEHHARPGDIIVAAQSAPTGADVTPVAKGFWRLPHSAIRNPQSEIGIPQSAIRNPKSLPSGTRHPASSIAPYMIEEVHHMVESGYHHHVGALQSVTPVFLQFTGFHYDANSFESAKFHDFFAQVMEVTHRYEGRLNRVSMGDKGSTFLILFGAPRQVEKKEELACRWALDLQEKIRDHFRETKIKIGMTSGRVFSGIVGGGGRYEYTVMGDVVNLAARLMQGAKTNQICCSKDLKSKAEHDFAFADLGTRAIKGKSHPVSVFALRNAKKVKFQPQSVQDFVGRTREIAEILEHMKAASEGSPRMALVEGEAGVGKSFLAARILSEARRAKWTILSTRSVASGHGGGYAPWVPLLTSLLFGGKMPTAEQILARLRETDESFVEYLPWHLEYFGLRIADCGMEEGVPQSTRPQYDEETRKNLLHHQICRMMMAQLGIATKVATTSPTEEPIATEVAITSPTQEPIATKVATTSPTQEPDDAKTRARSSDFSRYGPPALLFFDDLHWFDSLSLDLLLALLNHLKDQRLMLLATTRPNWQRAKFKDRSTCHFIRLHGLGSEDVRQIAVHILGGPVRDALVEFLSERSRGNPFFTRQLLDHLKANDLLVSRLGEWTVARGAQMKGEISGQDVIVSQIDKLPLVQKIHLRVAACIGPVFALPVLQKAMGDAFRYTVFETLRARDYFQDFGAGEFSFPHALVQETIYRAIPDRLRKTNHRQIGCGLEAVFAGNLELHYTPLAHHFFLSGAREKAIDYCIAAGEALHQKLSFPEAAQHLANAYKLLARSDDERKWRVGLKLAETYNRSGKAREGLNLARNLRASSQQHPDRTIFYDAALIQFECMHRLSDYSFVSDATLLLERSDPVLPRAGIKCLVGIGYYHRGSYDLASECASHVLQAAKENDLGKYIPLCCFMLTSIANHRRDYEAALAYCDIATNIAVSIGDRYEMTKSEMNRSVILMEAGRLVEAKTQLIQLFTEAESSGNYYLIGYTLANLGKLEIYAKNYGSAANYLQEARATFNAVGMLNESAKATMDLGIVFFYEDKMAQACEYYLSAAAIFQNRGETVQFSWACYNIAEVMIKMNKTRQALNWVSKGMATLSSNNDPDLARLFRELLESVHSGVQV